MRNETTSIFDADARPSGAEADVGSVTSGTGAAEGAAAARATYGVDGTGLKIGIISDSFGLTHPVTLQAPAGDDVAKDQATGDLPYGVTILVDGTPGEGEMDEGRGIAQLAHDVAPGASFVFYAAGDEQQDMAKAVLALAQAGCQIIVDDVIFPDEPAYQDGVIAQAIDQVVQTYGVVYFSSAGNQNGEGWQGHASFAAQVTTLLSSTGSSFVDPNTHSASGLHLEQFGGAGEAYLPLTAYFTDQYAKDGIPTDVEVMLQWNQPFAGGASVGPTSQLELLIQDAATGRLLPVSALGTAAIGDTGESVQIADFQPVNGHAYKILVADVNTAQAPAPTDLKIIVYSDDAVVLGDAATDATSETSATQYGHSVATDAIAVGAADFTQTPAFGTSPPVAESFSSLGPDVLQFAADGTPLATPVATHGPDITAADGGDTTFFPEYPDSDTDGDGLPNFYGTSAAVAEAGAVTALLLQADPQLGWSQVKALLQLTAIPMADPDQSGAGLIQAVPAVRIAEVLAKTPFTPVFASNAGDVVHGSASAEILVGGPGDDTLAAGPGAEILYGDEGSDRADFAGFSHDYALSLSGGAGGVSGGPEAASDTLNSIETVGFLDGALTFDPGSEAAEIVRLYDSFLGRTPDAAGFESYLRLAASGATRADLAANAAASPEFASATAGLNDTQYVTYVYEHSLHREPDATGLQTYVADLENGTFTRTSMIVQAADSPEHVALTAAVVAQGLWVPDETVESLELLYDAAVRRQPDAFGLSGYSAELSQGFSFKQIANQMATSPEFQAAHAGQSDAQFIASLYQAELGRQPDPGGLGAYEGQLAHGYTRGDVLYETAFSQEHQSHVLTFYDPLLG